MNITKLAILTLFSYFPLSAMEIERSSLMVPESMGDVSLYKQDHGFVLNGEGRRYDISSHDIDPMLRKADNKQLAAFLTNGYIKIKQYDNGDYALSSHGRIKGGGPVAGAIAYWGTKLLIWGTVGTVAAGGVATVVAATGGTAVAPLVAAGGAALADGVVGATAVAATVGGVTTAAGTLGASAMGAAATTAMATAGVNAPLVTAAFLASGGTTVSAAIATVETASAAVGWAFTVCPFLP